MTSKEAIEILQNEIDSDIFVATEYRKKIHEALSLGIKALEERPQGKWGKWVISEIRCPNCLEYFDPDYYYSKEELNKCPNCGAQMIKEVQKNED